MTTRDYSILFIYIMLSIVIDVLAYGHLGMIVLSLIVFLCMGYLTKMWMDMQDH